MYVKKRMCAALFAAMMLFNGFSANASDSVPEAYVLPDGVTADTWEYRELVPDIECETLTGFENRASSDAASELQTGIELSTQAHSGTYSIARTARAYAGVGFKDDIFEAGEAFHVSAYLRSDLIRGTETMPVGIFLGNYYKLKNDGTYQSTEGWLTTNAKFQVTGNWKRYDGTFTIPESAVKAEDAGITNPKPMQIGLSNNLDSVTGATPNDINNRIVDRMYVDDWSIRKIPAGDFANAACQVMTVTAGEGEADATVPDSIVTVGNGDKVTFNFTLDIDPRTVRKEQIAVNGVKGSSVITSAAVTKPQGTTRKTSLTLTLGNLQSGTEYIISLDEIEDAWGREVSGDTSVTVKTKPALTASVSFEKGEAPITSFEQGVLTARLELESNEEQQITVVAAAISNGVICKINSANISLVTGQSLSGEAAPTISVDATQADSVRIFIWTNSQPPAPVIPYSMFTSEGISSKTY